MQTRTIQPERLVEELQRDLAGLPALSMPCGRIADEGKELPVGLQLIGPWFDEAKLLGIAEACESVLGFRV